MVAFEILGLKIRRRNLAPIMFRRPLTQTARFMSTNKTVLLSPAERSEIIPKLSKWSTNAEQTTMSRALKFQSFSEAWGFMTRVALRAEKLNHHPEWKNVHCRPTELIVGA